MEYEKKANEYSLRYIVRSMFVLFFMWILNELNIFIVDKELLRYAAAITIPFWMIVVMLVEICGTHKKWAKYVILAAEVIGVAIIYIFISYHVILVIPLPFLMAANYQLRRVTVFTYVVSVICICIAVILNYQYGLCDMNMVIFSNSVVWDYGNKIVQEVEPLSLNNATKILLYFAFPRCLILTLYAKIASNIAKSGKELHIYNQKAKKESKTDAMTGLCNKNEYLRVIKEEFPHKDNVGVIFIDVNNLKMVNDKFGHEKGDELIKKAAKSIKYIQDDELKGYRTGGDEFVILVENATTAKLVLLTEQWKKILDMLNETDTDKVIHCSAAYGYSCGNGSDINNIIDEADKNMYECKKMMKSKKE